MMKRILNKAVSAGFMAICLLGASSCSSTQKASEEELTKTALRGELQGETSGEVIFTKAPEGPGVKMLVNAKVKDGGFHGIHVHQYPVCEGDFTSAGGHFNPERTQHGHPDEREHHIGDLGNLKADANGEIVVERTFTNLSLDPASEKYIGNKTIIIHAKADDYATQPTGASGDRIGCAILQNTAE